MLFIFPFFTFIVFVDFQAGRFYSSLYFGLMFLVLLPVWFLFSARNTYLKHPVRYVLSDAGISLAVPPVNFSSEWSWVKRASESRRYILVTLKGAFVLLPKNQLNEAEIASVRAMLGEHLKGKARLRN